MTRRYTSGFDILGFDTDPTPGDPDLILNQVVPFYQSIGDDSQDAVTALKSSAISGGSGQTMTALRKLISEDFPPKLQKAADSFHSAASIYTTYAQSLTEAQNQLDQAMDQASPVAVTANTTVQPAPANATAAQVSAVQQQQRDVDQASTQLTAAKRLGQDAKNLRDQAGNKLSQDLNDVSAIPGESFFQKLKDVFDAIGKFIKDNFKAILEIIADVAIAITAIFFPPVGLLLGVLDFAANQIVSIVQGNFSVGSFILGFVTLAVGGGSAVGLFEGGLGLAKGAFSAATGLFKGAGTASGDAAGAVEEAGQAGSYFGSAAGTAAQGVQESSTSIIGTIGKFADTTAGKVAIEFGKDFGINAAGNGATELTDHQKFSAAAVFGGAAAGAAVGASFRGAKAGFGFDKPKGQEPPTESPAADEPDSAAPQLPPIDTGGDFHPFDDAPTPAGPTINPATGLPHGAQPPVIPGTTPPVTAPPHSAQPPAAEPAAGPSPAPASAQKPSIKLPPLGGDSSTVKGGTAFTQAGTIGNAVANTGTVIGVNHDNHEDNGTKDEPDPSQEVANAAQSVAPTLGAGKFL